MQRYLPIMTLLVLVFSACGGEGGELDVRGIEPRASDVRGNTVVSITGSNFDPRMGYTVYFGSENAGAITIVSDEEIKMIAPAQDETGTVDVTVLADNGPAFKIPGAFVYGETSGNISSHIGERTESKNRGNLAY